MRTRWRPIPFLIAALALAQGAFALPLRYSTYTEGTATLAAAPDGAIVSVALVHAPPPNSLAVRVMKLAPVTQSVLWSTTLPWFVNPSSVAVAQDGSVWFTGTSLTTAGIPVVNPLPGSVPGQDRAFIAHLSADGSTVLMTSQFGNQATGNHVAIAPDGSVYWSGVAYGGGIPTTAGVIAPNPLGGESDAFVARLTPAGAFTATLFGGNSNETNMTLAIGGDGSVYLAGSTISTNLPTTPGAFQPTPGARGCGIFLPCTDGFVARVSADLTAINYLTYIHELPGAVAPPVEKIFGIAVNAGGDAFITGMTTYGALFPTTPGAFQQTCRVCVFGSTTGAGDAFVMRLNASGSALVYSTFLSGGTQRGGGFPPMQTGVGIALDAQDTAWVTGWTTAADFPLVNPFQSAARGRQDVFVSAVSANGHDLTSSTLLGATDTTTVQLPVEYPLDIVVTQAAGDAVWVAGQTDGLLDFPTTPNAYLAVPPPTPGSYPGFLTGFARPMSVLAIDTPAAGMVGQSFAVGGWAIDQGAAADSGIDTVHVWAYPNPGSGAPAVFLGAATLGFARGDIGAAYGPQFANAGWTLDVGPIAAGTYLLAVWAHSSVTDSFDVVQTRSITVAVTPPVLTIDAPAQGAVTGTPLLIRGSAVDLRSSTGTGVDAIHVWAYPNPGSGAAPVFLGVATYGLNRDDVKTIYGSRFAPSGYELQTSLAAGTYLIAVSAHSAVTNAFEATVTRTITVVVNSQPLLTIDAPSPGATSSSPVFIGGWAVDLGAGTGTGIDAIHVWAYPNPGSGAAPFFVGVANYGVMRGDVGAIFGSQFSPSGYELSAALAPGTYLLAVAGHSTVTNSFAVLQTRVVTVQ